MKGAVAIVGEDVGVVRAALEAARFVITGVSPELVVSHGGDGTLLRAERLWPGIPKVPVRVGRRARPCARHELGAVIAALADEALVLTHLPKLGLTVGAFRGLALNDVVMRNALPTEAVRFRVGIGPQRSGEITGDGLVIATPFGSSAYYRSITRRSIGSGLALAFNNTTDERPPVELSADSRVDVEILRGPAILVHDNDVRAVPLRTGHRFTVSLSSEQAAVLGLDALTCEDCRKADGAPFNPH